MQFLVLSQRHTDRFTDADFESVIPAESDATRRLYADGVVRQIWRRDDVRGACLLVEAESVDAAQAAVDSLPLARAEMAAFTVIPLRPYGGFGPQ